MDIENFDFWQHGWKKHGVCAPFSQSEYFTKALEKHNSIDLRGALGESGITPSNTNSYDIEDFVNAINKRISKPSLLCDETNYHLLEIRLCMDGSTEKFQPCIFEGNCKLGGNTRIKWPKPTAELCDDHNNKTTAGSASLKNRKFLSEKKKLG